MLPETRLDSVPLLHRGKVRDTYDLGERLLMVATDRISAYDRVLPTLIPDKGRVLTGLSVFWFQKLGGIIPNHLVSDGTEGWPAHLAARCGQLDGRAMIVKKADRLPYECVVRGYLAGSGWSEYQEKGTLAGEVLPEGLREGDRLREPQFTPARKNELGHYENISFELLQDEVGYRLASKLRDVSIELYEAGSDHASERGILLADTKFEFGFAEGRLTLIDEVLTPDSSRFWLADEHEPGRSQPSLDKQYVRDWLAHSGWDRESDPPELPADVVAATRARYLEAYRRITGKELNV